MLSEHLKYKWQGSGHHNQKESGKLLKTRSVQPKRPSLPTMGPEFGMGEDETPHRDNVRYLKQVFSQRGSDSTVESLMKRTFLKRRHDVTTKQDTALNHRVSSTANAMWCKFIVFVILQCSFSYAFYSSCVN